MGKKKIHKNSYWKYWEAEYRETQICSGLGNGGEERWPLSLNLPLLCVSDIGTMLPQNSPSTGQIDWEWECVGADGSSAAPSLQTFWYLRVFEEDVYKEKHQTALGLCL